MNPVGYIYPTRPGLLEIEDNAKQHTATRMREIHKEVIQTFCEMSNVQKDLTKQIVQVINAKYMNTLRGRTTVTITVDIQTVLAHLMQRYSVVESDTMDHR